MVRGQTQSLLITQNNNLNRWRAYGAWIDGPLRRTEDCSAVPFPKYCTFYGLVSKLVPKIGAPSKAKRSKSWVVYCNWLSSGESGLSTMWYYRTLSPFSPAIDPVPCSFRRLLCAVQWLTVVARILDPLDKNDKKELEAKGRWCRNCGASTAR